MSIPPTVPETHDRSGDDARDEIRRVGLRHLLANAGRRLHAADGTSYARALGLSSVLSLLPGLIAVVGVVTALHLESRGILSRAVENLAPGPAGSFLTSGVQNASSSLRVVLWGLGGVLLSGTFAMLHLERGANRIYGVDEHRPGRRRFLTAAALASTAGLLLLLALGVIVAGEANDGGDGVSVWALIRWPVAVVLVAVAMTAIFRYAPNRRQPALPWLLSGTSVAVALWIGVTLLLGLVYENLAALGSSFGPVLGVIALLVWAYLTGVAVLYGLAFAAELESERAGQGEPERESESEIVDLRDRDEPAVQR